jgi:hypothetical protein
MSITAVTPRVNTISIMNYLREKEVNVVENQKLLALLKSWGRIKFNVTGPGLNWKVVMDRNDFVPYSDLQEQVFNRPNRYKQAELGWAGYRMSEQISEMERLQNGDSKTAIIKLVADTADRMMDDMGYGFNNELFVDGSLAANAGRISGLKTVLGKTGNSAVAFPVSNTSYAGIDMTPAAYGGALIDGAWPYGQMDPNYAFFTPLQVAYDVASTAHWPGTTWADNCIGALRYGLLYARNRRGAQGRVSQIFVTATMWGQLATEYEEKVRLPVERGEKQSLYNLGFGGEVINFDGVEVTFGSEIGDGEGFGINKECIELNSMKPQLFNPNKDMRLETLAQRMDLAFFGQMRMNPRGLVYWGTF